MLKQKEYRICDRCKKELSKTDFIGVCGDYYFYDLCEKCKKDYDEYNNKVKDLRKQWDELTKEYQFEKYLPKEEVE